MFTCNDNGQPLEIKIKIIAKRNNYTKTIYLQIDNLGGEEDVVFEIKENATTIYVTLNFIGFVYKTHIILFMYVSNDHDEPMRRPLNVWMFRWKTRIAAVPYFTLALFGVCVCVGGGGPPVIIKSIFIICALLLGFSCYGGL